MIGSAGQSTVLKMSMQSSLSECSSAKRRYCCEEQKTQSINLQMGNKWKIPENNPLYF
jgi:hypothetical protein